MPSELDMAYAYPHSRNLSRPHIAGEEVVAFFLGAAAWVVAVSWCTCRVAMHYGATPCGISIGRLAWYAAEVATLVVVLSSADCLSLLAVRLYQRFAPLEVRLRCVAMPSCSEYAAMAIVKYRLPQALHLIYRRLRRCHGPVHFVDFP
ncbi:MAG: membrane protein insertion efficiency factor YidD [Bacteroidales bacterium]|nr:membrane protein insertion efficiency factor YidD [Bacteroidales bacterium]